MRTYALSIAALAMLGGCGTTPGSGTEEVFTSTIVTVNRDGTPSVTTVPITRSQQLAQIKERETFLANRARGITLTSFHADSGCAGASMWMYDQTNRTGNQICFYSDAMYEGTDLSIYLRAATPNDAGPPLTWAGATRSYWPGSQAGYFDAACGPGECFCDEGFASWGSAVDTAGNCAQQSTSLWFTTNH